MAFASRHSHYRRLSESGSVERQRQHICHEWIGILLSQSMTAAFDRVWVQRYVNCIMVHVRVPIAERMKQDVKLMRVLMGLGLLIFSIGSHAQDLSVSSAWSLAPPPVSENGAVYLVVENQGSEADMLTGVQTDVARHVELHAALHVHGQMKMQRHHSFEIPPNSSLELIPGGRHIMLMGLVEPLKPGQKFDLNLKFMKAGEIMVEVEVVDVPPSG